MVKNLTGGKFALASEALVMAHQGAQSAYGGCEESPRPGGDVAGVPADPRDEETTSLHGEMQRSHSRGPG